MSFRCIQFIVIANLIFLVSGAFVTFLAPAVFVFKNAQYLILLIPIGSLLAAVEAGINRSRYRSLLIIAFLLIPLGLVMLALMNPHFGPSGEDDLSRRSSIAFAIMILGWVLSIIGSIVRIIEIRKSPLEKKVED